MFHKETVRALDAGVLVLEGGDDLIVDPGLDGVPVAGVVGGLAEERSDESEGEAELSGVVFAAEDFLGDGVEPGESGEFSVGLIVSVDPVGVFGVDGAEGEEGDGEVLEGVVMEAEEVFCVVVEESHVESGAEDNGIVTVKGLDTGSGLSDGGEASVGERGSDHLGDLFGRAVFCGERYEDWVGH
jgi:hypothetical protein